MKPRAAISKAVTENDWCARQKKQREAQNLIGGFAGPLGAYLGAHDAAAPDDLLVAQRAITVRFPTNATTNRIRRSSPA